METVFGAILLLIVVGVGWCVAGEGAWGAALTFLAVLFAGLLAMNFFEPLAVFLESTFGSGFGPFADLTALLGLFALFTFLLRLATDSISPTEIELDGRAHQAARWLFAAATGYTTMAILLTALHTAPLPRDLKYIGFRPEQRNFFDISAPDRQWLGFVQHVSEKVLRTGKVFDGPEFSMPEGTTKQIWPSFPIRYATRRQDYSSGRKVGGTVGAAPAGAAPAAAPSGPAGPSPGF
ncbi:MAG: CvpA family protein [Planctomycetia bacterium]|nr:CvpA family protein [Planctomycetia bacterium]